MSRFTDLIKVADDVVIQTFGDLLRWNKAGGATVDLMGIVDEETEIWGPDGELAYLGKAVTFRASEIAGFARNETVNLLNPETGEIVTTFRLQKTLSNDDGLRIIEIIE